MTTSAPLDRCPRCGGPAMRGWGLDGDAWCFGCGTVPAAAVPKASLPPRERPTFVPGVRAHERRARERREQIRLRAAAGESAAEIAAVLGMARRTVARTMREATR